MIQAQKVKIKIIKVDLDVKFPCSMHIELNKEVIASSEHYEYGSFIFNCDYEISVKRNSQTPFWEAVVALRSSRGANYNSGIIRLRINELIGLLPNMSKVYPLSKCYDPQAQIQLAVLQVVKSAAVFMASQPKLMTVYENSRSGSEIGIMKQKSQIEYNQKEKEQNNKVTNYNNYVNKSFDRIRNQTHKRYSLNDQNKEDFYQNIVQKIEAQHMKQKMQQQSKDLKQKTTKIKQLQKTLYKCEQQNKILKQQVNDLQQQNNEKQNIISELEQQILSMHIQLQSTNSMLQQKQQAQQMNQQVYTNFLKEIQMKHKIKQDQANSSFKNKIQLLTTQNQNFKVKLQQKQAECVEHINFIQQCSNKIYKLQQKLKKQSDFIQQMQNKQKQLQYLYSVMTKQRDDTLLKHRQACKQLEQLKNLKKSYRVLQDELNIVKKKAQSSVKQSSSTLQRINSEYKKKIQFLTQQLNKTTLKLKQVSDQYGDLCLVTSNLNETIENKQKKHKQISKQLSTTREKTSLLQSTHNQTKSTIIALSQNCEKMKVRIQQLELIEKQIMQNNEQLKKEISIQKQKVMKLSEQLNTMKFDLSKHQIALSMKQFERDNTHLSCRNKQQQLANQLEAEQEKNIALQSSLTQYKHKYQENQRLMHQLRLQETKNREQVSILTQKLQSAEKRISKFEQQLKDKGIAIVNITQQKNKAIQANKQSEKKIIELTLLNMTLQQQNSKSATEDHLTIMRLSQMENQLQSKQLKIQLFETNEFELRKKYNNEKEKLARAENQIKIVKRQLQRYINKIRTEVSHCIKLQQNQQPVECLIKHHQNSMMKLSGDVAQAAKELQEIKVEMQQKNRVIGQLQRQIQTLQLQISNKDNNIECLQELLDGKEDHLADVGNEHNQLLSIHEEYIFTFNRYKIDKEEEIRTLTCQVQQYATLIKQLKEQKQIHDTQIQSKIIQINMQKEINFQLESKIKVFLKEIDKYDIDMKQIYSQLETEEQRNNRLGNQINIYIDKNHMLSVENESLSSKISQLQNQLNQSKQMLQLTNKSKQKSMKENMQRSQALMAAEYQINHLKMQNETLQRQQQKNKQQISELKQNLKTTKNKLRLMSQQMNSLKQNLVKNENKLKQKSLSFQELRKSQLQNQQIFKSKYQTLSKKCKQYQQKSQLLQQELNKLKQQSRYSIEQYITTQKNLTQNLNNLKQQKKRILSQYQDLCHLHRITQNQLDILKQTSTSSVKQMAMLKQKNEILQREISQKEEALYIVTGKLSQLQLNWQNQEKRMALKACQFQQHLHDKIQQISTQYQQKLTQMQIKKSKCQSQNQILKQQINMKASKMQKLQNQMQQIEDHCTKKIKIYQNQMNNFSNQMNQKIENLKRQQLEKQRILNITKAQKDSLQIQFTSLKAEIKLLKDQNIIKNNELTLSNDKIKSLQNKKMQLQRKIANNVRLHRQQLIEVQQDIKKQFEILVKGSTSIRSEHGEKISDLQIRIIRIMQQRIQ